MKKIKRIISLFVSVALISSCTLMGKPTIAKASGVNVNFAKGADVGWLPEMEKSGFIFKNDNGDQQDALQILKDHEIDSIRLRTWVSPSNDPQGGHCSADETVAMAVRAKAMGFKIMIDFHYSDSWADPGKQVIPEIWKNDNLDQMKTHLYDYTHEVMKKLKDAGVTPEWVQVGNEINPGMLLPMGSLTTPSNLAQLINSGYDAVKAVSPTSKVILHRANGYDNANFRNFFDKLEANGTKYDVIGVSYYPDQEGDYTASIDALGNNLNDMASRYGKEVMVVEVGGESSIDEINVHNMLIAVQNKVLAVPDGKGIGVFYWEPQGAKSWSGYSWSAWNGYDGTANDGKPTKALDAFLSGEVELNPYPVTGISLDKDNVTVEVGNTATVNATLTPSNSTYKGVIFSSSDENIAKVNPSKGIITGMVPGTATITATSYDQHKIAKCDVTVIPSSNLITNPSFELGEESWDVTGNTSAVTFENDAYKGDKALHYFNGDFEASQKITGLENGSYKLSAWASGSGGEKISEIFATNGIGEKLTKTFTNTGWKVWNQYIVNNIQVTDGTITIGANVEMSDSGGQWGNIDNFELIKIEDTSLKELQVNGAIIKGFDPNVTSYDVALLDGTTVVPTVTATPINSSATVAVKSPASLPGHTTVTVTSGSKVKTYIINFTVEADNPVKNSGFESSFDNWTISDWDAVSLSNDRHSGLKALGYWKAGAFELTASQKIAGLENGIYSLSAWSQGDSRSCTNQIFAENSNGDRLSVDVKNTGWAVWSKVVIKNIKVTDGTLTIGLYLNGPAGYWGSYDDFELIQTGTISDTLTVINSVVTTPASVRIVPGGTMQLNAKVDAEDGIDKTVSWSSSDSNNKVIVDENGFVSVEEDAALGDYEIKAVSKVDGSKFGITTIKVVSKSDTENLIITNQPDSLSLTNGQTARFEIEVTGRAPFNYKWKKNNKDLEDGEKVTGANGSILKIERVVKSDEGEYSCIVTDKIGNVTTSSAVTLSVRSNSSSGGANTGLSSGGSSINSSNGGSNTNSSSRRSSTSSSNGGSNTSSKASNNGAANIPYIKPVVITNITKEEAKAIEGKIITGINSILGESTTAEQTKEWVASNGNKLSITQLPKNGKTIGVVITTEGSSLGTTIPIKKDGGEITAVYKYLPLLDKYIKLSEGVVIGIDAITLPTQANATYIASTSEIPAAETVAQGWTKVDNNWYMVNATGEPQVGWQKDNVGWTYLSKANGVMQIDWILDGGKWYYLKDNGYMAIGWIKDKDTWYYCNPDGSMAANTVVEGYQLSSNGAWIS
jgi:arabinogalactan endo-1,4-beta-galactosidase